MSFWTTVTAADIDAGDTIQILPDTCHRKITKVRAGKHLVELGYGRNKSTWLRPVGKVNKQLHIGQIIRYQGTRWRVSSSRMLGEIIEGPEPARVHHRNDKDEDDA